MGLGIICSGQGNQSKEMFTSPWLSSQQLAQLTQLVGYQLTPQIELSDESLFANQQAQPLIAGLAYIQWQAIRAQLPPVIAMAGYSLGELTAYALSGAFDCAGLIRLANLRAKVMDNAVIGQPASGLLAVNGLASHQIKLICGQTDAYLAIQNGNQQHVIGGFSAELAALEQFLSTHHPSARLSRLKVGLASHTPLLAAAASKYQQILSAFSWQPLLTPLVASTTGQVCYAKADAVTSLAGQLAATVYFDRTLEVMLELGVSVILEIGPGNALSSIVRNLFPKFPVRSLNDFKSSAALQQWLAKHLQA